MAVTPASCSTRVSGFSLEVCEEASNESVYAFEGIPLKESRRAKTWGPGDGHDTVNEAREVVTGADEERLNIEVKGVPSIAFFSW